jgi:hypothetical protein
MIISSSEKEKKINMAMNPMWMNVDTRMTHSGSCRRRGMPAVFWLSLWELPRIADLIIAETEYRTSSLVTFLTGTEYPTPEQILLSV